MSATHEHRPGAAPEITVAVAGSGRPLRSLWLLNALEDQTLAPSRWEVVVAVDEDSQRLLADHPLAVGGVARIITVPAHAAARPGALRNAAWRAAQAPAVVFLDPELRPPERWLELTLAVLRAAAEELVVEGAIAPDPLESALARSMLRTIRSSQPPATFAPAANVTYPRELLLRLDGWDESLSDVTLAGIDLAARARRAGVHWRADRELVVYSAVSTGSALARTHSSLSLRDLPMIVGRYPELRHGLPLHMLRRRSHAGMALMLIGALTVRRSPLTALLFAPWAVATVRSLRSEGFARALGVLPRRALEDVGELALLSWGSVRHRSPLL